MSWSIQDHADAGLTLLQADADLTVFDGKVTSATDHYVLVYTFRQLPTGLVAPDKIRLTGQSRAVDMRMYCHCVGTTAAAARAVQGRVQQLLLDVTPTVAGRVCFPIRWIEGQQTQRDEETLRPTFDEVDVYGWSSVG